MENNQSISFIRKRRLYTVLPLLVLPFLTFLFWILGGGQPAPTDGPTGPTGFNFNLPDAYLGDQAPLDKLGFYEQAEKDSLLYQELLRNDPYYQGDVAQTKPGADSSKLLGLPNRKTALQTGLNSSPYSESRSAQEQQVYKKLDQLTAALNASTDMPAKGPSEKNELRALGTEILAEDPQIQKIEKLMESIGDAGVDKDPELDELNGMLEKILDIQHPQRVQNRLRQTSSENKGQVFALAAPTDQMPVTTLDEGSAAAIPGQTGFYSLDEATSAPDEASTVQAVVHQTQELVSGSTVKLRLVSDVYVNGVLIPEGTFLYGIASLDSERLKVQITSFRYQNALFPVALSVVDMDGLEGIHIPGAISRDAAKQSSEQAIQGLGIGSFNQSLGAQAANAGIELTRNLLSKKVRLIRVTVKAGYQVLLKDQNQTQLQ
ncbi:conjugative transposon protein TraM [Dyadobacter luteus]|uniref:Conjugative transposon protein TraM n=1 Tax=Dyadobacter luteus TaxID=2259619 RepID=A0A3D8Y9M4_9BACT|nr:conjugative transposon protein TraM [Dyadobacter luteus]REA60164.1 conjugative transposon protein TraM [Dyadobacter luteus]